MSGLTPVALNIVLAMLERGWSIEFHASTFAAAANVSERSRGQSGWCFYKATLNESRIFCGLDTDIVQAARLACLQARELLPESLCDPEIHEDIPVSFVVESRGD